jgi:hypothetical protein
MSLAHSRSFSFSSGGGQSDFIELKGPFVLEIAECPAGATVTVVHSVNDGARWTTAAGDAAGSGASYTVPRVFVLDMPVSGVRTRVNVTGTFTGVCSGVFGY